MCTNQSTTKAILVVSFGTSYHDTREKTIDCIEQDIAQTFPHQPYLPCLDQQKSLKS